MYSRNKFETSCAGPIPRLDRLWLNIPWKSGVRPQGRKKIRHFFCDKVVVVLSFNFIKVFDNVS